MSLTNTNREGRRHVRAGGLRDLRFAGIVAAGLVAGVLGVGALSAPLLGWTDWPDQLQPGGNDTNLTMKAPALRQTFTQDRPGSRTSTGPAGVPGVGLATAAVIAAATGTTGTGTGAGTPAGGHGSSPDTVKVADTLSGSSVQGD